MYKSICLLLTVIMALCCLGCAVSNGSSAATSSVLSSVSVTFSSEPKYVLSDENTAKIESYKNLPDSDEEIITIYHKYFDLSDISKQEMAERGYTVEQIAQIDYHDYEIIVRDWSIVPNNSGGRTYGDLEEEARQKYEKYKQDRMPTPDQQARLDELGIEDWILWEILDEGYDTVDHLLSLPEEKIIELRDLIAGAVLVGEASQNWRLRIRARYFEITGLEPFVSE